MNDSKSYTFNLFKSYEVFVPEASVNSDTWSKAYIQLKKVIEVERKSFK